MSAQAGAYYQKAQMLDLFGHVTMNRSDGYVVETEEARINLKTGSAEGNKTVTGHGPAGTLRSDGFRIIDKGQTVMFTGKARLVIDSRKRRRQGRGAGAVGPGRHRRAELGRREMTAGRRRRALLAGALAIALADGRAGGAARGARAERRAREQVEGAGDHRGR